MVKNTSEIIGKYYKIFSLTIEGIKYYFVGSVSEGGFRWIYRNSDEAVEMFNWAEKFEEKIVKNNAIVSK